MDSSWRSSLCPLHLGHRTTRHVDGRAEVDLSDPTERWHPTGAAFTAKPSRMANGRSAEHVTGLFNATVTVPWPDRLADTRACLPAESSPRIRVCGAPFRIPQQTIQQMWSEIRGVTSFRQARRTSFQQRLQPKHGGDEV